MRSVNIVEQVKALQESSRAVASKSEELRRLATFLERMRQEGVVSVKSYDLSQADTVGRRFLQSTLKAPKRR